jgi:hypothetical protein
MKSSGYVIGQKASLAGSQRVQRMPELSRFFGIKIRMFFKDHAPPHFHAIYGDEEAVIALDSLGVIKGELSPKALALVVEWALIHRSELQANWESLAVSPTYTKISPLR